MLHDTASARPSVQWDKTRRLPSKRTRAPRELYRELCARIDQLLYGCTRDELNGAAPRSGREVPQPAAAHKWQRDTKTALSGSARMRNANKQTLVLGGSRVLCMLGYATLNYRYTRRRRVWRRCLAAAGLSHMPSARGASELCLNRFRGR